MTENKHTAYDLKQMQSLPLEQKIIMTERRIREWYEHWDGDVYVSFSGGKDSTVLKHIVDSMYDDVPSVFVDTGLEYPEIRRFAMEQKNVTVVRPKMKYADVIKKCGYPVISKEVSETIHGARTNRQNGKYGYRVKRLDGTLTDKNGNKSQFCCEKWAFLMDANFKISHMCCDNMKKHPAKEYEKKTKRKPIIGTMAEESRLRYESWIKTGCNAFDARRPTSQPLSFWTEHDILHYIKRYNIPYCSVYGDIVADIGGEDNLEGQVNFADYLGDYGEEDKLKTTGCKRTGCVFCAFGCHIEKEPNRFQRLKQTHPKLWNYCINGGEFVDGMWQPNKYGLGFGYVLDYLGVKYE